jgi:hypothetical protein
MEAAQVDLVGMEVRRAEPFTGEAALGNQLEISSRGIDLDGFLLNELGLQFGLPKVAHGFLAGEKNRFVEFAAEERRVGFRGFEYGAAACALGEKDLGDIEERVNPRNLVDFLADEMHGVCVRRESDADTIGRRGFLVARRAAAAVIELATTAFERWAATIVVPGSAAALIAAALIAPRLALAGSAVRLGRTFLLAAAGGARPCGTKGKTGQQTAEGIVFGFAHGAHSRE